MLSPGRWHEKVPKGYQENLRFRRWILEQAAASAEVRKGLVEVCSKDLLFYINTFVWQFNPRKKGGGEIGPFVTWGFQDAALRVILDCVEMDKDLCIEKSREMGASWMILIAFEWLWHFLPWQKFLVISRNEKAVEDEDPDSLFWKIDHIHSYMPTWLLPQDYKRRKLFYGNGINSTITGQASTGQAGVGGRATAMAIDEFSQIKEDYEVLHRTSDTTGCRIFNFTHLGLDTAAYELTERVDMRKLVLHWTRHPEKNRGMYRYDREAHKVVFLELDEKADKLVECLNQYPYPPDFDFVMDGTPTGGPHPGVRSPWYDDQCRRKGSARAIAMDLDINPKGSVAQFFDPILIHQLKNQYGKDPLWEGDITFDREEGKLKDWARVDGGPLRIWVNLTSQGTAPLSKYGAGADISTGNGTTPSCLTIVDGKTGVKVLEYANAHIEAHEFGRLAVALCRFFADENGLGAKLCWEHGGPGVTFGKNVIEVGYRHVYYKTAEHKLSKPVSDSPGWSPNGGNKRALLEDYRSALQQRTFLNHSERALDECLSFRYTTRGVEHGGESNTEDPTAARENHGDRVIADALAHKMIRDVEKARTKKHEETPDVRSLAGRRLWHAEQNREEESWT